MKKQIIPSVILSLVLLFTACQSEDENLKSPENETGKITFSMPAPSGTVSYATVTASADENLLNKLDIYMFNEDQILEYLYADVTANGSGASRTATIDVTGKSGAKTFYFVANAEGQSAELSNAVIGTTTLSEFKEIMTDKQVNQIKAWDGLLMSATKSITDVMAELSVADKTINLRRRVARFDVQNDASVTNFEISKIIISKANLRNYLFEDATGTPPKTIETDKLPALAFNTTDFPDANSGNTVSGVFYIYPTVLEEGKTEISIEGLFNGITKIYTVSLPASTPIKANYRYILKAKKMDITNITWEVSIDEWEDGSEVETGPGNPLFTFSGLSRSGGAGGVFDAAARTYDISDATTASVLSFKTSSINKLGTTATVTYKYDTDASSLPGFTVATPQPVLIYGASYTQDYKIDIPVQTEKVPVEVLITISDVTNPQQKVSIFIHSVPKYDNTAYTPVLFKGKYWAPVNVGASEIDATIPSTTSMGFLFQWGRNVPFTYGTSNNIQLGSVSYADAIEGGKYADKFIAPLASPYDWLTSLNNNLWSGSKAQGPCPTGWRVPTGDELQLIANEYSSEGFNKTENRYYIIGDGNKNLYFPAAGHLQLTTGILLDPKSRGLYWGNTTSDVLASGLGFTYEYMSVGVHHRANAFSVRCIQAD